VLEPGDRIDRYVVEGELGEGALATVYRVRHTTLSTVHALKVVKVAHRESRDRLIREGQVQAQLSHPNIVAVTDVLEVRGSPGTLMEWVRGVDLEEYLLAHRMTLEETLTLFRGVVAGVGHAHAKGLVHRDLKPANVLLALDDDQVVPKVSDFGLVKALHGDTSLGSTRTGMTMGTPGYMAPEQVRDAATVDRRADMWSLGCLLYRMACNYPAFAQADIIDLFTAVGQGDYPHPHTYAPELPDPVVQTIRGLLEVDPALRFHDCAEVIEFLDGGALPTAGGPGSLPEVSTPRTDRPCWLPLDSPLGRKATAMREAAEEAMKPQVTQAPAGTWDNQPRNETIAPLVEPGGGADPDGGSLGWPVWLGLGSLLATGTVASAAILTLGLGAAWQARTDADVLARADGTTPRADARSDARPDARSDGPAVVPQPVPTAAPGPAAAPEPAAAPAGEPDAPTAEPAPASAPPTDPTDGGPARPDPGGAEPTTTEPPPQPAAPPQPPGADAEPSGSIQCASCDGVYDMYPGNIMGTPAPNGRLAAGSYWVWIEVEGEPFRTIEVTLPADDTRVDLRCTGSMRSCAKM